MTQNRRWNFKDLYGAVGPIQYFVWMSDDTTKILYVKVYSDALNLKMVIFHQKYYFR